MFAKYRFSNFIKLISQNIKIILSRNYKNTIEI